MQRKKPDIQVWQQLIGDILAATHITQCQLAKEIGVAHNSIHGWLNGRSRPRHEFQLAIVEYCMKHRLGSLCKKYKLTNLVTEITMREAKKLISVPNDDDYFYI